MAFSGQLSDLNPPELLQMLSLTRKTGKLLLAHGDRRGVLVFNRGKIVFAASDGMRSAFGVTLARGKVVADSRLIEQVAQRLPGSITDSGSFLVQFHQDGAGTLSDLVREQIAAVVTELVTWSRGHFRFEPVDLPESGELQLEAGWFVLRDGVEPEAMLLDALTKLDEGERARWERDLAAAAGWTEPVAGAGTNSDISAAFEVMVDEVTGEITWAPATVADATQPRDPRNLHCLLDEAHALRGVWPALTADATLLVLRFAAQVINRGVLLARRDESLQGIGQFGLRFPDADARVRQLSIPLDSPSILAEVVAGGSSFVGVLPPSQWVAHLLERIGGSLSNEMALIPLSVDGTVVAVLCGDNLPHSTRVGGIEGLELLMREVGAGVEEAQRHR
jgi:hypothetical protein